MDPGETILAAFSNQTGNLTQKVKVVDEKTGYATGKEKPRFVLHSGGYLDVKAYVAAGLAFPSSSESFQGLHPKDKLQKLTDLDPSIYQETEDAMVGVHDSCAQFNRDALPNFTLITNLTKTYAETAIKQLTGLGDGSFQAMLDILTSDKYKDEGSENSEEFQGAAQAASGILKDLSTQADAKAKDINSLVKQITSFESTLKDDKERVDSVCLKYHGAKGQEGSGYISKLNTNLATLREDVKKAAAAAKAAHDEFNHDTSVATWTAAYIWIPIFGWIAGTWVAIDFNSKSKEAYEEYEKQLGVETSKDSEVKSLENVIGDVSLLSNQSETMSDKMTKAMAALVEVESVFQAIAKDLDEASSMMGSADGYLRASLWQRKRMIRSRVESAVESWQDVQIATDGLLATDGNIQTSGIVDGVDAPEIH